MKEDDKVDDIPCAAVVKRVGRNLIEESIRKFIKQQLNVTEEAKFTKNIYMYVPKHILFYESLQELPLGKYDRKSVKNISIPKLGRIDKLLHFSFEKHLHLYMYFKILTD